MRNDSFQIYQYQNRKTKYLSRKFRDSYMDYGYAKNRRFYRNFKFEKT